MNIALGELQEYCAACPIAYYAGRSLPLKAACVPSSYANIVNGEIVISLPQVNNAMKDVQAADISLVRPLVYHEVSHVILTPRHLDVGISYAQWNNEKMRKMTYDDADLAKHSANVKLLVNLFEDERIETVSKDTYMEVDFYKNCCRVNDWHRPVVPTTAFNAFYMVVRLHAMKSLDFDWKQFYERSRQLILKWAELNPNSSEDDCKSYCNDICDLYYDFVVALLATNQFKDAMTEEKAKKEAKDEAAMRALANGIRQDDMPQESEESDESQIVSDKSDEKPDGQQADAADEMHDAKKPDETQDDEEIDLKNANVDGSNQSFGDTADATSAKEDDDVAKEFDLPNSMRKSVEELRKSFAEFVFDKQDENVKQLLLQKFFIKDMHGKQMNAIHKHHGKLDVKAVGRDDWKIFKRRCDATDGSKLGKKMHLILVLDQSGSYSGNDYATNLVLASLVAAEKRLKGFEFTLVKFGNWFRVCKKEERYSESHEGTEFSVEMFKQIDALKRQDSANFIIFLNDGAAWTTGYGYDKRDVIAAMKKALDHNNCVCILDDDAYSTWFKGMKKAKMIVTSSYVEKLSDNVCEALGAMISV